MHRDPRPVTREELDAETCLPLPDKEVLSLLNLDLNLDVVLDLAAPIDLAIAANANVAAPINASVAAGVLAIDSTTQALGTQDAEVVQLLSGEAEAEALQDASVAGGEEGTQTDDGTSGQTELSTAETAPTYQQDPTTDTTDDTTGTVEDTTGTVEDTTGAIDGAVDDATGTVDETTDSLDGTVEDAAAAVGDAIGALETDGLLQDGLLNVDVDAAVDADLAAPIAGAVAANANVAAPINASVAANIASIGSEATAVADQTAVIVQEMDDVTAEATADQDADVDL